MRIASLATIPGRESQLKITVESLLVQVDRLNVYLNDYKAVPEWLTGNPRIHTEIGDNSKGDAGKFYWADKIPECYHFICDDDIGYPIGYTQLLTDGIEKYNRDAVVSLHGRKFKPTPISNYYRDCVDKAHCRFELKDDIQCHSLGTGAMGYHTSTLTPPWDDFKLPNMADVWMGVICQKLKIPMVALKHHGNWIKVQKVPYTIFDGGRDCKKETEIVNSMNWEIFKI